MSFNIKPQKKIALLFEYFFIVFLLKSQQISMREYFLTIALILIEGQLNGCHFNEKEIS